RRAGTNRLVNHPLRAGRLRRPHIDELAARALAAAKAQQLSLPGEQPAAGFVRELAGEALAVRERLAALHAQIQAPPPPPPRPPLRRRPHPRPARDGGAPHRRVHRRGRWHQPLPDTRPARGRGRTRADPQTVRQSPLPATSKRRQQGPQARPLPVRLLLAQPPRQPSVPHPQTPRGKATPSNRDRAPTPPRRRPPRTAAHTAALPTRTSPSRLTNALGCLLFRQVEEHFLER